MRPGLALVPVAAVLVACGDAPGTVQGGEPLFPPPVDCSQTGATCATWSFLYACYFGGSASNGGGCSANADCHTSAAGTGAAASGFVCGTTQASCYQGITSTASAGLSPLVQTGAPAMDPGLIEALYKAGTQPGTTANNMPLTTFGGPPVMPGFSQAAMTCIKDWVSAGAKDD